MSDDKKKGALFWFAWVLVLCALSFFSGAYAVKKGPVFWACTKQCVSDVSLKPE